MTLQIDLPPDVETRLHEQAAREGQATDEYVRKVIERALTQQALLALKDRTPPQTLADLKARVPSPPGTSWLAQVRGQWPGDETDEMIFEALETMS
jgi:hypothetical protein